MTTDLFTQFEPKLRALDDTALARRDPAIYETMTMATEGKLRLCYTPFEYVNPQAKLYIVGLTPGPDQMFNAWKEAKRILTCTSMTAPEALKAIKAAGAFSGKLRTPLVRMLDMVGVHQWLGLRSSQSLFEPTAAHLVQTTSVLQNGVLYDGTPYNGTPKIGTSALLRQQAGLLDETLKANPLAKVIFLGAPAKAAAEPLLASGRLDPSRILGFLTHPSGANAERVAYFLGDKPASRCSPKVRCDTIDEQKSALIAAVRRAASTGG